MTLRQRLAEAKTMNEECGALQSSVDLLWPWSEGVEASADVILMRQQVAYILAGPRAGWIGVPLLTMPEGYNWELTKRDHRQRTSAELWRPLKVAGDTSQWHFYEHAQLPACALMLAVLSALSQGKDAG